MTLCGYNASATEEPSTRQSCTSSPTGCIILRLRLELEVPEAALVRAQWIGIKMFEMISQRHAIRQ